MFVGQGHAIIYAIKAKTLMVMMSIGARPSGEGWKGKCLVALPRDDGDGDDGNDGDEEYWCKVTQ